MKSIILLSFFRIKNGTLMMQTQEVIFREFPCGFLEKLQNNRHLMVPGDPCPPVEIESRPTRGKSFYRKGFFAVQLSTIYSNSIRLALLLFYYSVTKNFLPIFKSIAPP